MKVLGLTCGRKVSNTEILVKEALMGAEEVTEQQRALSHFLLSGKFHHAEDLKNISLNPDPRMSEIPVLIEKYKSYLTYSKPDRDKSGEDLG